MLKKTRNGWNVVFTENVYQKSTFEIQNDPKATSYLLARVKKKSVSYVSIHFVLQEIDEILMNYDPDAEMEAEMEFNNIAEVAMWCQKKFKASLSYEVVEIISEAPDSWVKIRITLPDGRIFDYEGKSKKHAANGWAESFKG